MEGVQPTGADTGRIYSAGRGVTYPWVVHPLLPTDQLTSQLKGHRKANGRELLGRRLKPLVCVDELFESRQELGPRPT